MVYIVLQIYLEKQIEYHTLNDSQRTRFSRAIASGSFFFVHTLKVNTMATATATASQESAGTK
jgi:hypothetical protein